MAFYQFVLPGLKLNASLNSVIKSLRSFCWNVVNCFPNSGVPSVDYQLGKSSSREHSSTCSARLTTCDRVTGYHFFSMLIWETRLRY